jgi:hypothetical protein
LEKKKVKYVKPQLMKFGSVASVTGSGKDASFIDYKDGEFCMTNTGAKENPKDPNCDP